MIETPTVARRPVLLLDHTENTPSPCTHTHLDGDVILNRYVFGRSAHRRLTCLFETAGITRGLGLAEVIQHRFSTSAEMSESEKNDNDGSHVEGTGAQGAAGYNRGCRAPGRNCVPKISR